MTLEHAHLFSRRMIVNRIDCLHMFSSSSSTGIHPPTHSIDTKNPSKRDRRWNVRVSSQAISPSSVALSFVHSLVSPSLCDDVEENESKRIFNETSRVGVFHFSSFWYIKRLFLPSSFRFIGGQRRERELDFAGRLHQMKNLLFIRAVGNQF